MLPWVFWSLLVAGIILLIILSESKSDGFAAFIVAAIIIGLLYLGGWLPNLTWIDWLKVAALYLPAGVLYSIFRFKMFCRKKVNNYNQGSETRKDVIKPLALEILEIDLSAAQNKTRITNWIADSELKRVK